MERETEMGLRKFLTAETLMLRDLINYIIRESKRNLGFGVGQVSGWWYHH